MFSAACLESRRSRVRSPSFIQVSKKHKEHQVSSPLTCKDSVLWEASVKEMYCATVKHIVCMN